MKKFDLKKNMTVLLIAMLSLCFGVCVILFFILDGYTKTDITGHWRICRYAIEGYNPYLLIGQPAQVESIGKIPEAFSTVPWSCIFGSVFYGGFLPLNVAYVYIFVMHFAALAALLVVFYNSFKDNFSAKHFIVMLLIPVAHFSFMYSTHFGNAGGIISCMLMIAFLIGKNHPYIAGVLLGFSMMKPQLSAIICIVYLLNKQFKVLFTAAGIVLAGWAATCIFTSTNPVELLLQTFSSGTAASTQYLGLLNNLKYFGVDSKIILLINVAIGCIYTVSLYAYLRKKTDISSNSLFLYVPACLASTFWIYKNGTDYMIIAFATIFFCLLCLEKKMTFFEYIVSFVSIGWLEMSRCAVYMGAVLFPDNLFVRDLFKSADGLVIAVIGIVLCMFWVKYDGSSIMKKIKFI